MTRYQRFDGGKVHLGTPVPRRWLTTIFCTGRSMRDMLATTEPVTCKACIKRAKANGINAEEPT